MSLFKMTCAEKTKQGPFRRPFKKQFRILAVACVIVFVANSLQTQLTAQTPKPAVPPTNQKKMEAPPEPEHLILGTMDGVKLKCTYFAAAKSTDGESGKSVVPIILLHDWAGDRRQLLEFGAFLQSAGHAALVPDLRGHGESVNVTGLETPIDATKFRKGEVASTQKDIERCKKFLVQRHNAGEVNIDLLCVVAVGQTCVLAVEWTLNDWFAFPPYNTKGIKQGQDVKALLLVSPEKKLAGVSLLPNLKHPLYTGAEGAPIPMMILWGASDDSAKDSEFIHENLKKARPDVSEIEDKAMRFKKTSLFGVPVKKSKFAGVELMKTQRVNGLWAYVERTLISKKVAANAESFPWKTREATKEEDE